MARLVTAIGAARFDTLDPHVLHANRPWREDLYTFDGHAFLVDPNIWFVDTDELSGHFDKADLCPAWFEHLLAFAAAVDDSQWGEGVVAMGGGLITGQFGRGHPVIYKDHEGKRVLGLKGKLVGGSHSTMYRWLGMPYKLPER